MIKSIELDRFGAIIEFATVSEAAEALHAMNEALFDDPSEKDLYSRQGNFGEEILVNKKLCIGADDEELISAIVSWLKSHYGSIPDDVNEDFTMGVEGATGLDQGIPQGGPGKGVLPKPFGPPMHRPHHDIIWAVDFLNRNGYKPKKKKKHHK